MPIQARLIHPTGTRVYLRRYASAMDGGKICPCDGMTYHNADTLISETDEPVERFYELVAEREASHYDGDERWPTHCACGYAFTDADERQVNHKRRWSTGSGLPELGDLFWVPWHYSGTPHLHAICPDGRLWNVDGVASNGPGWTRTGEPPAITCSPSIWTDMDKGYHGFLQGGVFSDDLSGKTFDAQPYEYM